MKKLLIIGAGSHGHAVAETAQAVGYNQLDFLDDNNPQAIGKTADLEILAPNYDKVFVSIGNNSIRKSLMERLENAGVKIASLIHPLAYVSPSALIGDGTIILPGAVIHTNAVVGKGCIVSIGALIDHDAVIGDYCHINTGAVIGAGDNIPAFSKVQAGEVLCT